MSSHPCWLCSTSFAQIASNQYWTTDSIIRFEDTLIPYMLRQAGTGNIYHHLIAAHLKAILEANQSYGLNSIASDQKAAHHIVKLIGEPLGLPLNQLNPSQAIVGELKFWLDSVVRHFQLRDSKTLKLRTG